ncbi:PAS domain-containing protein [Elioraea sp.]|uniref:PAS domain-containing protein n=1 Tax=Elioraea sp. TaxID=2185103 RepID=UPI0025B854AA|nr:PAS domain-containing protein [Elioraea sp.]
MPRPLKPPETAAPASGLHRLGAAVPWAIAALSLALAIVIGAGELSLRAAIIADSERELLTLSKTMATATEIKLASLDKALERVARRMGSIDLAVTAGARHAHNALALEHQTASSMLAMLIVSPEGEIIASSRAVFDEGDREPAGAWSNLAALAAAPADRAVIGTRSVGTVEASRGMAIVTMSRPLMDGTAFTGAVEALLSLDTSDGLLQAPPLPDGTTLTLAAADGAVLMRLGASPDKVEDEVVATTALQGYGLTIVAARPMASVLGAWHRNLRIMGPVALLLCLAGLAVALLARWAMARQASLAEALAERARTADAIADSVDAVLWSLDARTGSFLHMSPSVARITGHPPAVLVARPDAWLDIVHPDDREIARAAFADKPEQVTIEYRMVQANGGEVVLRDSARAVRDAAGTILRYDGMAIDVTDQRRTEAALDEARGIARLGVWQIHLPDWRLEWSPELYAMFGVDPARFRPCLGNVMALVHPDDVADVQARHQAALGGEEQDYTFRILRPDGGIGWIWSRVRLARGGDGSNLRLWGVCQDITDRKRSEERLARSAHLAALGELTGGIAHDFNNLLGVVRLNLDLITTTQTPAVVEECAASALAAAESGARLTAQLLAFARRQPMRPTTVPIDAALAGVAQMLDRALGSGVTLTVETQDDDLAIEADQAQFESALMNLALNARDAMPRGGTITLRAEVALPDAAEREALGPGPHVAVSVIDDGMGMPPDVLARAAEPFFTTKGGGKGSGLGLAMVYGFARQAGGEMRIESRLGAGTRVTLWLKRATLAASTEGNAAMGSICLCGTAVLVEDEAGLRRATTAILTGAGLVVHEAGSAAEALALIEALPTPPDLLLSDVTLGGTMDGFSLARTVREAVPGIAVLLVSGYAGQDAVPDGETVLRKPYGAPTLLAAVAETLAAREAGARAAA